MGSQKPCIYRVPGQLREVKPEAYRPRMLLIGPLHHSAEPRARNGNADSRYLEYEMMEDYKVIYKASFTKRPNAVAMLEQMTITFKEEEENIRASYAVSTAWILPSIFMDLILNDSIFIVEFILRIYESRGKIGDLIVDNPFYSATIVDDLTLLENQLPYSYLKKALNPIISTFCGDQTLDQVILQLFSVTAMIKPTTRFNHFTDMFRCVYMESLGETPMLNESESSIVDMKSGDKLSSVGVEFQVPPEEQETCGKRKYSLKVQFKEGCLIMSSFPADESSNIILRNVIAYEQCHDPEAAFTTNYIHFMNFLVTTDKDVDILTSGGVLANGVGRSSMMLETVNNLCNGVLTDKTQYHGVVKELNTH